MNTNKGIVLMTVAAVLLGSANVAQARPHFGHHGGIALAAGLFGGLVTGTILSHAAAAPVVYTAPVQTVYTPAPTVYTAPAQVITTPAPVVYSTPTYSYSTPVVYEYGYSAPVYYGGYYGGCGYRYSAPCPPPPIHRPSPVFHGGPIHRGPAPCAPRMGGHPGGGFHGGGPCGGRVGGPVGGRIGGGPCGGRR